MAQQFDVVIIGTGEGGSVIANKCRKTGWSVAIIDSQPYGGTCALRGCDPKKVLVGAAELVDWNHRMKGLGIKYEVKIDWKELMKFKHTFTDHVPEKKEHSFKKAGINTFHGRARFVNQNSIRVGDEILEGRYLVIATGSKPRDLNIPGDNLITTSTEFLELEELPNKIVFIGGGYISFEFAHVAARAGAEVCILHRGESPLGNFDPDLVDQLITATRDLGITVKINTEVSAIEKDGNQLLVHVSGKEEKFQADIVVHGAGRVPNINSLDLENASIKANKFGILVNEFLQSISNPVIYAAGDVSATEGAALTPVAVTEGHTVASNILKGNSRTVNYRGIPSVVFTIPALASVGLQEKEAKNQGLKFKVNHRQTDNWYASRRTNEKNTGFKLLIEDGTGRILGAHLSGSHAGEVINIFGFAMRNNLPASAIRTMIYSYPTHISDISYMV